MSLLFYFKTPQKTAFKATIKRFICAKIQTIRCDKIKASIASKYAFYCLYR